MFFGAPSRTRMKHWELPQSIPTHSVGCWLSRTRGLENLGSFTKYQGRRRAFWEVFIGETLHQHLLEQQVSAVMSSFPAI